MRKFSKAHKSLVMFIVIVTVLAVARHYLKFEFPDAYLAYGEHSAFMIEVLTMFRE